jgi:hypothetical protein
MQFLRNLTFLVILQEISLIHTFYFSLFLGLTYSIAFSSKRFKDKIHCLLGNVSSP